MEVVFLSLERGSFKDGDRTPPSVDVRMPSLVSLLFNLTTICLNPGMIAVGPSQRKYGIMGTRFRGVESNEALALSLL